MAVNKGAFSAGDNQDSSMETTGRMLACRTCGKDFEFTVREQEFFKSKGFDEPRHCAECRAQRKRERNVGGGSTQHENPPQKSAGREWTEIPCASCGRPASVPFKPTSGRPVYCRDCFANQRSGASAEPRRAETPTPQPKPSAPPEVAAKAPKFQDVPPHILDEDMGPLPDIEPGPDEEGEITVADFLPMGGGFGATPEEIDPSFNDSEEIKTDTDK